MNGIKVHIVENLKGRAHPVNDNTALSGIDNFQAGFAALRELVANGTVKLNSMKASIHDQPPVKIKLYILSYDARMNNTTLLKQVK